MIQFPEKEPIVRWTHKLRSRYAETDKMGYVYYGRYFEYFEEARTEMIRHMGLPYSRMEEEGVMLPVVDTHITYRSPVHYDEEMAVEVLIYDQPGVKLETWYRVMTTRQEEPHVLGRVMLVFIDVDSRRPRQAPADFLERLNRSVESEK
jgi:acyl-CoA thioester hydrolase